MARLVQLYDDLMAPSGLRVTQFSLVRTREMWLTRAGEKAVRAALPHWRRAQIQVANKLGPGRLEALVASLSEIETLHPDPGRRARG